MVEELTGLVRQGVNIKGEGAQRKAEEAVKSFGKELKRFAAEINQIGRLTLESTPEKIEQHVQIAQKHGKFVATVLSPFYNAEDSLKNEFFLALLRKGFKKWPMGPSSHRTKDEEGKYLRFYHTLLRLSGVHLGLIQRQAVDNISSLHAHWSVEGYTFLTSGTKLRVGNQWFNTKPCETIVVPPGQIHQINHTGNIMSFTFLEIIGNPAAVVVDKNNIGLADKTGTFSKDVWRGLLQKQSQLLK